MALLDRIYSRSPVFVQNAMATGFGVRERLLRNGGQFQRFYRELDAQQWLAPDELQAIQDARVRRTVRFAATAVPYYRELFATLKLQPEDIGTAADLRVLPILDKATVQREVSRLRPDRSAVRGIAQTTGGTTGRPVQYFTSRESIQFNYAAYEARFRDWAGVKFGDRMVSLNGRPIVPVEQHEPPFWRHNLAFNQLYVSAFHISDANLPVIVERIATFEPRVIVAYTSVVHRVAQFINATGWTGRIRPHAVMVSSETLFPWMREEIERAFECKVFNGYSLGEPVCFVSECPAGTMHASPEYGVIELSPDGDNGEHEILATGLINDAMPFLRYRTGDRALLGDGTPCSCGRGLPTFGTLIGRIDENVITPEGVPVGPTALGLAFKVVPHLAESQVVQDSTDRITIRVVTEPGWCQADAEILVAEFRKRLGSRIAIDLEPVTAIPRTSGGKQRLIMSSLKRA